MYGNVNRGVPLFFSGDGSQTNLVGDGLPISGKQRWNDGHILQIQITDINGNALSFTSLILVFSLKSTFDGSRARETNMDLAYRQA